MARPAFTDLLQTANFYLFDVGPIDRVSIPIFTPLFGFNSISSPELTLSTQQINQANALYPHDVITGASVGPITLSRGVSAADSDFWRWINVAARGYTGGIGGVTYRRHLLLVHFFRNFYSGALGIAGGATTTAAISAITGAEQGIVAGGVALAQLAVAQTVGAVMGDISPGQADKGFVKVPARAFLLRNCIPVRYKAGSDYDAATSAVSIAELEINVESFEEIALAAN